MNRTAAAHMVAVALAVVAVWWVSREQPGSAARAGPEATRSEDEERVESESPPPTALRAPESAPEPLAQRTPDAVVLRIVARTLASARPRTWSPVAGAAVEVGIGRRVRGEGTGPVLTGGSTDEAGELVLTLPWALVEPELGDRYQQLWLRASVRGFLPRVEFHALPTSVDAAPAFELSLQRGALLDVLVLGPDGEPAAGRVTYMVTTAEGKRWTGGGGAPGSDGRTRLTLNSEGTCVLFAEARSGNERPDFNQPFMTPHDLGTGVTAPFELRFDDPPTEVIEIRTQGPGSLRGRVTDAVGRPTAGLELRCIATGIPTTAFGVHGYDDQFERLMQGGGHLAVRTLSDADGRFEFLGLRREEFSVYAVEGGETLTREPTLTALTPDPVLADGRELELRFSPDYLAFRVVHPDGRLYEEPVGTWGQQWLREPDQWPETPRLVLAPLDGVPHDAYRRTPFIEPRSTGPGEFAADVPTERRYLVGLLQRATPWLPQTIDLPAGAGRVDVTLTVAPAAAPGALVVDVHDVDGAPVREAVRVLVLDPLTGFVLLQESIEYERKTWPPTYSLPPGDYLVDVQGHPWVDMHHGTLLTRRAHGGFEQQVTVVSAEELRVDAVLGTGARLHVTLRGSPDQGDVEAVLAEHPTAEGEWLERWSTEAQLRLLRERRWPTRLSFARYGMAGTSAAGVHLWDTVSLGSDATSELISAGTYTLVATLPGGRELRREVELFDGVTTDVTLEFE